jgi:hypothetical protein
VFTFVKLPLLTLAGLLVGLPLLFRRKLGDGRYFILFWLYFFFMGFSVLGGKFTRYYTVVLPAVLITAAIGIHFTGRWLARQLKALPSLESLAPYARTALVLVVLLGSVVASIGASPYFRLFLNSVGGGTANAGFFFPHDEFYDTSMRDVMAEIARRAKPGARVASESPTLATYYSNRANRFDLNCVSLSDAESLKQFQEGDFVLAARGRRYFSNDALVSALHQSVPADFHVNAGTVPSVEVYRLDQTGVRIVSTKSVAHERR